MLLVATTNPPVDDRTKFAKPRSRQPLPLLPVVEGVSNTCPTCSESGYPRFPSVARQLEGTTRSPVVWDRVGVGQVRHRTSAEPSRGGVAPSPTETRGTTPRRWRESLDAVGHNHKLGRLSPRSSVQPSASTTSRQAPHQGPLPFLVRMHTHAAPDRGRWPWTSL